MSYEIYYNVFFIGGLVLAGIMFVASVLLFFLLNIPHVLGDLTGRNAKKAIENIRNQNESSGDKLYKTSQVNRERGKLTDKISPSGSLMRDPSGILGGGAMATEKISTQQLPQVDETTVLESNETTVLSSNETTVLDNAGAGETTVLTAEDVPAVFQIEYEITFIHTDEVIA